MYPHFCFANFLQSRLKFALDLFESCRYRSIRVQSACVLLFGRLAHFTQRGCVLKVWLFAFGVTSARGAKTHKRRWERKEEDEEMFLGSVCCSVKLPLPVCGVDPAALWVSVRAPCHPAIVQGKKSAQTAIVLHTDLQLQAVQPNISALCQACKIQCHLLAVIIGHKKALPLFFFCGLETSTLDSSNWQWSASFHLHESSQIFDGMDEQASPLPPLDPN